MSAPPFSGELAARHYRTGEVTAFQFASGKLVKRRPGVGEETDLFYGPTFCDLQCNGYAGVDFNSGRSGEDAVDKVAEAIESMQRHGCTTVLPTIITADPEGIRSHLGLLSLAMDMRFLQRDRVPGYHVEGPFLSPEEGARGAHPLSHISPIRPEWLDDWQEAAYGMIRMVTVAPELEGGPAFIAELRRRQIVPALGHTLATAAQIAAAVQAGAMISTHLGNGCPAVLPRHENPIWAQAGEDRLAASLIADGHHLPPPVLRTLARALGPRAILVTDGTAASGAPPGRYAMGQLTIEVGEDRIVRQPGASNFAGSALTMNEAMANYHHLAGVPLAESWEAASMRPRELLARVIPDFIVPSLEKNFVLGRMESATFQVLLTVGENHVLFSGV